MSTQLDYQVGLGQEISYGTAVAPTRFFEAEASMDASIKTIQGSVLRPHRRVDMLTRRSLGHVEVSGDLSVEIPTAGFGMLLHAFFGAATVKAVPGVDGLYQQVHTPATSDFLPSFTIEEGLPLLGGDVVRQAFTGCMADSLELDLKEAAAVTAKVSFNGRDMVTDGMPAAASYPVDNGLLTFVGGSVGMDGTLTQATDTSTAHLSGMPAANVRDMTLTLANNMDSNGFNLGGRGRRSRPQAIGKVGITGKATVEFTSTVLRDAYLAQSPVPLVLDLQADDGSGPELLQVIIPAIVLDGEIPKSNSGDVITQSVSFTGLDNGADAPITVVYRSKDQAI